MTIKLFSPEVSATLTSEQATPETWKEVLMETAKRFQRLYPCLSMDKIFFEVKKGGCK